MTASSIRPGFSTVSPYLIYRDAAKAIAFYKQAFGAAELSRQTDDEGCVRHAEIKIGDSTFMLTSETPRFAFMRGAETIGDSPVQFFLYAADVDALFKQALAAGASAFMPIAEQSYGRSGGVKDPFGLVWWLSTHKEEGDCA